ncbi:MAG: hypothetical protein V4687_09665 [Bacteroidota bacterium]
MINKSSLRLDVFSYHNIFIVGNRNEWKDCARLCNSATDLVLCIDLGLKIDLSQQGYCVQFLDHLVKEDVLSKVNADMHHFLYNWHNNPEGEDILNVEGIELGNSFLLYLINNVTYFCHFFFNIYGLKAIEYEAIYVATKEKSIHEILSLLQLNFNNITLSGHDGEKVYSFPINQWMNEATGKETFMKKIKQAFIKLLEYGWSLRDFFSAKYCKKIYFQVYHPTLPIIKALILDQKFKLFLDNFTLKDKALPFTNQRVTRFKKKKVADWVKSAVLKDYRYGISSVWAFENHNMVQYLSKYVDEVVYRHIDEAISVALSIRDYFDKNGLDLMIPVTDLWMENRLIMNYCHSKNIPVYFIMNGLLNNSFSREGKDSKYVNCYSSSCKDDFFGGAENVYALGDPRMDKYSNIKPKEINRTNPTIIIGAAGYDVTDINSYLAYEFDFLYDILESISVLRKEGYRNSVVLKVRANGYIKQYQDFVDEYFPKLTIQIHQSTPFYEIIKAADLYISIYSQTQFEAACLGIPTIYYRKDTQSFFRPFDGESELITADTIETLTRNIRKFYANNNDFHTFMQKSVIESYIGPLDGKNLTRNIDFINQIINDTV